MKKDSLEKLLDDVMGWFDPYAVEDAEDCCHCSLSISLGVAESFSRRYEKLCGLS